jgi:ParB family chromosome partitioning protein
MIRVGKNAAAKKAPDAPDAPGEGVNVIDIIGPPPQDEPKARPTLAAETFADLDEIVGLDPCNSRRDHADDASIDGFAREMIAHGQAHPILVRGAPGNFVVLAGSRRFRALLAARELIAAEPALAEDAALRIPIRVRIRLFTGGDLFAREVSLAENVQRENLSPLDEAERFEELAGSQSFKRLAQRFGVSERFLRERLKLATLPDIAKAAWRALKFSVETARALTVGTPEKISELIEKRPELLNFPAAVRAALQPKGERESSPLAKFVGAEEFVAAGGEIWRDLFDDQAVFVDAALVKRLASEKLAALGEKICDDEGWGHLFIAPAGADVAALRHDFTADENLEQLEILSKLEPLPFGAPETGELEARRDEIVKRAALPTVARDDRKNFAIRVDLDEDGRPIIERALALPPHGGGRWRGAPDEGPVRAGNPPPRPGAKDSSPSADVDPAEGEDFSVVAAASTKRPPSPSPASGRGWREAPDEGPGGPGEGAPELSYPARRTALACASRAVAEAVKDDQDLARGLALAARAKTSRVTAPVGVEFMQGPWSGVSAFARQLVKLDLVDAFDWVGRLAPSDRDAMLAEFIAATVDLRAAPEPEIAALLAFVRQKRGAEKFDAALVDAFDYPAFFRAVSRVFALGVIRDLAGDAAERFTAGFPADEAVAAKAAAIAHAKAWLPNCLRDAKNENDFGI